jgi:hypothetical protein
MRNNKEERSSQEACIQAFWSLCCAQKHDFGHYTLPIILVTFDARRGQYILIPHDAMNSQQYDWTDAIWSVICFVFRRTFPLNRLLKDRHPPPPKSRFPSKY